MIYLNKDLFSRVKITLVIDLCKIPINYILSPFFHAITFAYTNTQKS